MQSWTNNHLESLCKFSTGKRNLPIAKMGNSVFALTINNIISTYMYLSCMLTSHETFFFSLVGYKSLKSIETKWVYFMHCDTLHKDLLSSIIMSVDGIKYCISFCGGFR